MQVDVQHIQRSVVFSRWCFRVPQYNIVLWMFVAHQSISINFACKEALSLSLSLSLSRLQGLVISGKAVLYLHQDATYLYFSTTACEGLPRFSSIAWVS